MIPVDVLKPAREFPIETSLRLAMKTLVATVFLSVLAACGRAPDLVGIDNAQKPVAEQKEAQLRKVFIATTREASEVVGVFYSAERAPELGLASVVVSIPPTHVVGQLERPKNLPPDPETEFAVIEPAVYRSENSFVSSINAELAKLPPNKRKILLFVHGYNNTTSDSILRMAQFVEDTGFDGVPILFAWASAAKASHYVYDLNSALIARPQLLETGRILKRTNATGADLFAHSMGSFLTVEAIVQAQLAGNFNATKQIENVMLAAPDIDLNLFQTQLSYLRKQDRNFTIFASTDDKALGFSKRISGGVQRVGAADASQLEPLGVTVIDLSKIDDSSSGSHSKFAGSPEIVQLLGKSLKSDNFRSGQKQSTLVEILDGVPVLSVLTD